MTYDGDRAIAYAQAQIGKPYQWAGTGNPGFDCSGLVLMSVKAGGGPNLPHQSGAQVNAKGVRSVPASSANKMELLPGDIVFWYGSIKTPASVTHCGIFVGKERYAATKTVWQCVAAVDESYGVIKHRMNWALQPSGFGYIGH